MVRHRKFDAPFVRKPFSVRVVVPTYKEDIETLEETVECAIKAAQEALKKGQANAGTLTDPSPPSKPPRPHHPPAPAPCQLLQHPSFHAA